MKYFLFMIFVFSQNVYARDGIYLSAAALPVYASGEGDSTSSLLGTGIAMTAGARLHSTGFEMGIKRFTLTNKELGDDTYDSEVKNSLFFGGARLFLDNVFSLKAGLASHYIEMDIYRGAIHRTSDEDDGKYFGIYGGMGIVSPITKFTDLYFESTLYPVSDIGFYFIDMEIGFRFYL